MTDADLIPLDAARRQQARAPAEPPATDFGPEPPPQGEPSEAPRRLPIALFEEMEASLEVADFVEGLMIDGGLSVTYGPSNSGKTFLICDVGFHVALGWAWHGRQVETGAVLYVAGEGGGGIKNRIAAFRLHHGSAAAGEVPFAVIPIALDLHDPNADTAALISSIREMGDYFGQRVRLVIVDTVSRALAGGDENDSGSMGALVRNVDRIRNETGVHVALVHHSGKETSKGARGHSLLRAAVDTEVEVSRDHDTGMTDSPRAVTMTEKSPNRPCVPGSDMRLKVGNRGNVATLQAAPRCGAKTRRTGHPCRCPAMANGRCRIHGGKSPGGPKGKANGRYLLGLFTAEELAFWCSARRLVRECCASLGLTPTGLPRTKGKAK